MDRSSKKDTKSRERNNYGKNVSTRNISNILNTKHALINFVRLGWNVLEQLENVGPFGIDTNITIQYIPEPLPPSPSVRINFGSQVMTSSRSSRIFDISLTGPVINYMLRSRTDPNDILQLAEEIIAVLGRGINTKHTSFLTLTTQGTTATLLGTIRHAVGISLNGTTSPYKLEFHKNSVKHGNQKGVLVAGLYINRPDIITNNSGGIQFRMPRNKPQNHFPKPGTAVSFYNSRVFHKVIPPVLKNVSPTALQRNLGSGKIKMNNGHYYVQRSAVFINVISNPRQRIPEFLKRKVGTQVYLRNVGPVARLIHKYIGTVLHSLKLGTYDPVTLKTFNPKIRNATKRIFRASIHSKNNAAFSNAMKKADRIFITGALHSNNNKRNYGILKNSVNSASSSGQPVNIRSIPSVIIHTASPNESLNGKSNKEKFLLLVKLRDNMFKSGVHLKNT